MNEEIMIELLSTDPDLLSIYHIEAPNTAEVCAKRTLDDLKQGNVKVHLFKVNDEVIGYYGIEKTALSGFFIKPEYRTNSIIDLFWKTVEEHFESFYYIGVYSKNTRAIDFLRKKTKIEYPCKYGIFFKVEK